MDLETHKKKLYSFASLNINFVTRFSAYALRSSFVSLFDPAAIHFRLFNKHRAKAMDTQAASVSLGMLSRPEPSAK
jgi:hypothetical protein